MTRVLVFLLLLSLLPGCSLLFPWSGNGVSDGGAGTDTGMPADSAPQVDGSQLDSGMPIDSGADSATPDGSADAGQDARVPWESCDGGMCSVCLFNKAHPLGGSSSISGVGGETGREGAEASRVGSTGIASIYIAHAMDDASTRIPIGTAILVGSSTTLTQTLLLSDAPSTSPDLAVMPSGDVAVLTLGIGATGDSGYVGILDGTDLTEVVAPIPTASADVQVLPRGCIVGGGVRLDGSRWPLRAMYAVVERGMTTATWNSIHYDSLGTVEARNQVPLGFSPADSLVAACSDGGLAALASDSAPDTVVLWTGFGPSGDPRGGLRVTLLAAGRTGGPLGLVYRGPVDATNDRYWLVWTAGGDAEFMDVQCPGLCGVSMCPGICNTGTTHRVALGVSSIPMLRAFPMSGGGVALLYRAATVEDPGSTSIALRLLRDDLSTVMLNMGDVLSTEVPFIRDASDLRDTTFLYGSVRSDESSGEIVFDQVTVQPADPTDPSRGFLPNSSALATCPH